MGQPHIRGCDCCGIARKRFAELAHENDLRVAKLQSEVDKFKAAFAEARKRTAHLTAEWAAEPWKSEAGKFFNMNSIVAQDALAQLCYDLIEARSKAALNS